MEDKRRVELLQVLRDDAEAWPDISTQDILRPTLLELIRSFSKQYSADRLSPPMAEGDAVFKKMAP